MKRSIFFLALVSVALAQQQGGYNNEYQDSNYYGYQDDNNNLYADYAKHKALQKEAGGRGGWIKLFAAGMGGYLVGAKVHGRRRAKNPKLRFRVKQRVLCKIGQGSRDWATGTIVKLWHEQSPGEWMPYQIKLDDGRIIFAPQDNDYLIRKAK